MKNILMGIGNRMRCDDGIGNYIAEHLHAADWLAIDCSTVPENYTSVVKKHAPEYLVLVDAAQMELTPGEFRKVDSALIQDLGGGTHALPLSMVINYMRQSVQKEVVFIGIQPEIVEDGEQLSSAVLIAAKSIIKMIRQNTFLQIPELV